MAQKTIELFFDVGSPYSYLAATQIEAVADNAEAPLVWRPFLLGAVFKGADNHAPGMNPAKARYLVHDLVRCAKRYDVPFQMATRFPLNTLSTQRALCAVERTANEKLGPFALALFHAYWAEDRDVSAPAEIAAIAGTVGLDGARVLTASGDQETKDLLRKHTDEAIARGAFGAPTIFVGDEMFFGNDRLSFVEQAARGE